MKNALKWYFEKFQYFSHEDIQIETVILGIFLLPLVPVILLFLALAEIIHFSFKKITEWLNK